MKMKDNHYQLGVVSVSFRRHSPEQIVRAAVAAGLSSIEWGSDVHAPCRDTERLSEIVRLQEKYGIVCSSYGTYFRLGETPIDELNDYIHAAKRLGTRILRLWCGSKSGDEMTVQERDYLIEQCRLAATIAEENDVILCMECHRGTFTQRPEDSVALMEAVNSLHFRMYWQPFQWLDETESMNVAKAVAPYVEHLHVFHWREKQKLPLSLAVDTWRTYLSAFSAPRTLLLEFMPDDRLESLATEAESLKRIVGEEL